jgi:iron complex outermembrane receptor protein
MLNAAQFRAAVNQYAASKDSFLLNSNTNWFDQVDRTGIGQEHNFAVAGAGEHMDYRASVNYLKQKGIIDATTAERVTLSANYNQRLFKDRLNLRFNLRGARSSDDYTPGGVISNAAQMGPTQPIHDPISKTGFYNWPGDALTSADNPSEILALAIDQSTTYRGIGNLTAAYNLPWIDGLTANLNLGFDATRVDRETFTPSTLHHETATTHGTNFRTDRTQQNQLVETYLNYAVPKSLGPGILDVTGGYSYSQSNADSGSFQAIGLLTDELGVNGFAATTVKNQLFVTDSKLISFFGRLNYNVNDRYLAAFTIRRDGSSRFGTGKQWGTFPSAAVAWRISEEPFLKGKWSLSDLKIRASAARTGNQAFQDYRQRSVYVVSDGQSQYSFGDSTITTARPSAVDPDIHWESTRSYDVGIDFGFMNQRITGAIDWYNKHTSDMIFTVPVAAFTNLSNFVTTNIGTMRNRGTEFSLSARILEGGSTGKGLHWTTDFTAAHNGNTLLQITPFGGAGLKILTGGIAGGVGTNIQVFTPGFPINSFFVFKQKYANGKPLEGQYVDLNGDGIINQSDLRPFHDPAPKWIFGHSSYLSYGKWDFGFTLRAYTGNYVYNNVASNTGNYHQLSTGNAPYNLSTSVLSSGFVQPQYQSDYYVEKASFLRMDNLSLGYSFTIRGEAARLFGNVQNVWTITGYDGVDPTAGVNGIDNNIYPRSRTFTGGLNLRF